MAVIFYPPRNTGGGGGGGAATWGSITGTLSSQTDLQTALNGKSDVGHTHTNINSLVGFATSENTSAPNNTVNASRLLVVASTTNADFVIEPKGTGAIIGELPDSAIAGGNKRGANAIDLQLSRTLATQVASGSSSALVGGTSNIANGLSSGVFAGNSNTTTRANTVILGGGSNSIAGTADNASILAGSSNSNSGASASIIGGQNNIIGDSVYTAIISGQNNQITGGSGTCVIVGGQSNVLTNALGSVILGGRGFTAQNYNILGFNANINGTRNISIDAAVTNTAVFNNVDLWLSNNDNTPRTLRFYEQYNSAGVFPNGTNYVAFRAPNSIATDVTWTLPNADGTNGQVLQTNGTGTLSWATPSGGGGDMLGSNNLSDLSDLQEAKDNLNIAISDVTNLQTTLDGKAAISHAHAISDVTNLQTTLDGKAATSHAHAISDVTNLQTTLDGKAAISHAHAISDVTNLQTTLDGKAATSHSHAISDVTNLQTSLDAKVNAANPSTTGIFTHTGGANEDATFNVNNNGRFRVTIDDTGRSAGWQNAVFTTRFDAANTNQVGVQADFTHTTGNASSTNFFTPLASSFGGSNKANFLVSYNPFGTWTNSTDVKGKLRFHVSDNVGISFGSDTSSGNRRFFFGSWSQEFGIIVPNGTNYDITIPSSQGAAGTVLTNDGSGGCSWAAAGGGVTGFTGSQNTSSPNNTVNASRLLVSASSTNADFVIQPKGTGAILAQLPDNTATGGNKRGARAVDLQMQRTLANQVASGSNSFTTGSDNVASGSYGTALGYMNTASGTYSTAIGIGNTCSADYAVGLGSSNSVSGVGAVALGYNNIASSNASIALGQQLTSNGSYSVATNFNNDVNSKEYSFVMLRGGRLQNNYTFTIGSYRSTTGDGQATIKILHAATTNATPTAMTGSGGSATYAFPSGRNVSVIATIQAMDSSGNGGMFVRQALFSRTLAAQIGTTETVGADIVSGALYGISVALAYSSGNLNVNVTGLGATNIQWLCKLELTELQYS